MEEKKKAVGFIWKANLNHPSSQVPQNHTLEGPASLQPRLRTHKPASHWFYPEMDGKRGRPNDNQENLNELWDELEQNEMLSELLDHTGE